MKARNSEISLSDGGRVAAFGYPNAVCVWDVEKKEKLTDISVDGLCALALSPDGANLVCSEWAEQSKEGAILSVYRVRDRKRLARIPARTGDNLVAFGADNHTFVTGDSALPGEGLRVWDIVTGLKFTLAIPADQQVKDVQLSKDGSLIAAGCAPSAAVATEGSIILWNAATGRKLRTLSSRAYALAFLPDGKTLISCDGCALQVWRVGDGALLREVQGSECAVENSLALSADGNRLASGWRGSLHIWDLRSGTRPQSRRMDQATIEDVTFAPRGNLLTTVDEDHVTRVWDAVTGAQHYSMRAESPILFSQDGREIVTAGDQGLVLRSAATGQVVRSFDDPFPPRAPGSSDCTCFRPGAFSRNGAFLYATAGRSAAHFDAYAWVTATGREAPLRKLERSQLSSSQYTPDGELVLSYRGLVHRIGRTKEIVDLGPEGYEPSCAAFSPDARLIVAPFNRVTEDGDVHYIDRYVEFKGLRVWEVITGRVVFTLPIADAPAALCFSKDGRIVACAVDDGFALWDARTGKPLLQRSGAGADVTSLDLSADGRTLATGLDDGTVLLWALHTDFSHETAALRPLTPAELEQCWADLASPDPAKGQAAICRLVGSPETAVSFLGTRLHSAPARTSDDIRRIAHGLESPKARTRAKAEAQLKSLDESAEPVLRALLANTKSPDLTVRLEGILAALTPDRTRGTLRTVRAIAALESIGSPSARRALNALAAGDPAARTTQEAKQSLQALRLADERAH